MKLLKAIKSLSLPMVFSLAALSSAVTVFSQNCLDIGGVNPSTYIQNFDGLGNNPGPRGDQSANLINLSALTPNNPPASRWMGRFDNTFNDANQPVNVPWAVVEEGIVSSSVSGRYSIGNGSLTIGNTYSFASTSAPADRALGSLTQGEISRNYLGTCFTNTTGAEISTVYISYAGEQWRYGGGGAADSLAFEISGSATNIFEGAFVSFPALSFVSPVTSGTAGALDGNAAANRTVFYSAVPVTIPAGATLYLRWVDNRLSGSGQTIDHALAIDDFRITLLAPTAARVSISGRVLSGENRAIAGARITLTDASGAARSAATNPFGYYRLSDVPAGATYVIGVSGKRFRFNQPSRILTVDEEIENLDFRAGEDF